MRKFPMMAVALAATVGTMAAMSTLSMAEAPDAAVKKVMKAAMKTGLVKKVFEGKATTAQKEELLKLFKDLHEQGHPKKGDDKSWDEKTTALLKAAEDVIAGKPGADAALKSAASGQTCHDMHK